MKHFTTAITYLEKARELKPENRAVLNSLKELYARTGNTEAYNEVKKAIDQ